MPYLVCPKCNIKREVHENTVLNYKKNAVLCTVCLSIERDIIGRKPEYDVPCAHCGKVMIMKYTYYWRMFACDRLKEMLCSDCKKCFRKTEKRYNAVCKDCGKRLQMRMHIKEELLNRFGKLLCSGCRSSYIEFSPKCGGELVSVKDKRCADAMVCKYEAECSLFVAIQNWPGFVVKNQKRSFKQPLEFLI